VSEEQSSIIGAPLSPLSVVACAGSGKTHTAVRRLADMRRKLGGNRGRIALLSFSNVAVDTFRREYELLVRDAPGKAARDRVEIDTLDGFITNAVLRPHAYRTMKAQQSAYLVTGDETFLSGFNFRAGSATFPIGIEKLQVGFRAGSVYFYHRLLRGHAESVNFVDAQRIVHSLGKTGAYTHDLGRYWCYQTLIGQPFVLRALVHRYPHLIIDEAQDIGGMHEAIIEQLISAGCHVSLIGDPNQGIYEFADATGAFLVKYGQRSGVSKHELTKNFRSVPAILKLANSLTSRSDLPHRDSPRSPHGIFFASYKKAEEEKLIEVFHAAVRAAGLAVERSAVLCRARDAANRLAGNQSAQGTGTVKSFVKAAILRDKHQDYLGAFRAVVSGVVSLLANPPSSLVAMITQPSRYPEMKPLRRLVWAFTRNPESGLPSASLIAATQWHTQMLDRTRSLLATIAKNFDLQSVANLGKKLAKRSLPDAPLVAARDLGSDEVVQIRIETVHRVKGESLDAVLYLTTKEHASALLAGANDELGRIGYVAVTRARDLFWLGVPANALKDLTPTMEALGFKPVGSA
jgi:superfamily I DNA/RNA helicase